MRHLLLLAFALASVPCQAGVVSRDLFEPGDGLLTYDDVNGREWLDFSVTAGLTPIELSDRLNAEPALRGFAVASTDDVSRLFQSATAPTCSSQSECLFETFSRFGTRTGDAFEFSHDQESDLVALLGEQGRVVLDENQIVPMRFTGGKTTPLGLSPLAIITHSSEIRDDIPPGPRLSLVTSSGQPSWTPDEMTQFESVLSNFWLFREAVAVPEPSTACLALMACLAALRLRAFA